MWYQETNKTHESLKDEETKKKKSKKCTKDIEQGNYDCESRMPPFTAVEFSLIC